MAQRRSASGEEPEEPRLRVPRSQIEEEIGLRLARGADIEARITRRWSELKEVASQFTTWDEGNEELLRRQFTTREVADDYKRRLDGHSWFPLGVERWLRGRLAEQMRRLESIRQRLQFIESEVEKTEVTSPSAASRGSRIFLVHGHDGFRKLGVAQFLQEGTNDRPIILHEPASRGRTIIGKFEDQASEAGFAVVLLTAVVSGVQRMNPNSSHEPVRM